LEIDNFGPTWPEVENVALSNKAGGNIMANGYLNEQDRELVKKKFANRDYLGIGGILRKAAEAGDAWAQAKLAFLHIEYSVMRDFKTAFAWYEKSAQQGDANGQYGLADCYKNGFGTSEDKAKALYWLKKAAEQGHEIARETLSEIEAEERSRQAKENVFYKGVEHFQKKEYSKAFGLFEQAAQNGFVQAYHNLGIMYFNGYGVAQSEEKAYSYFKMAADKGDKMAQEALEDLFDE